MDIPGWASLAIIDIQHQRLPDFRPSTGRTYGPGGGP
jgi:hypothetical protein